MIKSIHILMLIIGSCFAVNGQSNTNSAMLQTDRQCYISGDVILFKAILPFNKADVTAYVDLASADNEFIRGEILHMENGHASGFIQIPDSVKTNNYTLRVYTYLSGWSEDAKVLSESHIYITNRFGNNSERYSSDKNNSAEKDSLHLAKVNIGAVDLTLDNDIYARRSKITVSTNLQTSVLVNDFNGALTVKAISECENENQSKANVLWSNNLFGNSNTSLTDKQGHLNEQKGILVSGIAQNATTGKELSNLMVIMAFEDSSLRIKHSLTDSLGRFSFLVSDCFEMQTVYLSAYTYPRMELYSNINFELDNKFIEQHNSQANKGKIVGYQHSSDSVNLFKSIIAKAYKINYQTTTACSDQAEISYEDKFIANGYNRTTYIDNYITLPDFYQIAKEILPYVKIKEKNGQYTFIVFDGESNLARENPMVFVDGIPLTNYSEIMDWGSSRIKMVQVKVEPRYYGDVPFERGMILIWTKKMDFWESADCPNTKKYVVPCYQKNLAFQFPDYSKSNYSNIPDFRQILYWNPDVVIDGSEILNQQFYSSDEVGLFEICLSGITGDGKPVYIKEYFEVK